MIELLLMVMLVEMGLILLLLFKTPFRKLEIMGLDRLKRGRAPLVVKSVAGTILVIMLYSVYCVYELSSRPDESLNPTQQVLLSQQLLQASLMGFALFLSFMIDKLHHYMRELRLLRKATEAANKQNRASDDIKALDDQVAELRAKVRSLQSDLLTKQQQSQSAFATSESLQHQSATLLLQYDSLMEQNQTLRTQLHSAAAF